MSVSGTHATGKKALVIGTNYSNDPDVRLLHAEADAVAVGDSLEHLLGFTVTRLIGDEVTAQKFRSTVLKFFSSLKEGDFSIVYFSGVKHSQSLTFVIFSFCSPCLAQF